MLIKMENPSGGGGDNVYKSFITSPPANGYINCGFAPKYIMISCPGYEGTSTKYNIIIFDKDYNDISHAGADYYRNCYNGTWYEYAVQTGYQIEYVDSTGFKLGYPNYMTSGTCILATG